MGLRRVLMSLVCVCASAGSVAMADDGYSLDFYGLLDVGYVYQNHGNANNTKFFQEYFTQKNTNSGVAGLASSGLSFSKIGVSGKAKINDDVKAIAQLETFFNPTSGELFNGPASVAAQNGQPLTRQYAGGDSNVAGQLLNGTNYVGASSETWGTLTGGRHLNLMMETIAKSDAIPGSPAFSYLGYFGSTGGQGATENRRVDNSLKYTKNFGMAHMALLYARGTSLSVPQGVAEASVGGEFFPGFNIDLNYGVANGVVNIAPLSAAQQTAAPGTLAGTFSDNTEYGAGASYQTGAWKFYAGYMHINYANPTQPQVAGALTLNGYQLSVVNNTAFTINKVQQNYWLGAKYDIMEGLDVAGAIYYQSQNSTNANGCSDNSAGNCSGHEIVYAAVVKDRFSKNFLGYGGFAYSQVYDGMSAGFLFNSEVDPMVGVQYSF